MEAGHSLPLLEEMYFGERRLGASCRTRTDNIVSSSDDLFNRVRHGVIDDAPGLVHVGESTTITAPPIDDALPKVNHPRKNRLTDKANPRTEHMLLTTQNKLHHHQ